MSCELRVLNVVILDLVGVTFLTLRAILASAGMTFWGLQFTDVSRETSAQGECGAHTCMGIADNIIKINRF